MNDLVNDLRKLCSGHTHSASNPCKVADAADEIERLRTENSHLRHAISDQNRLNRLMNISMAEEVGSLRAAGDALADTGGQHGFDDALDNWREVRMSIETDRVNRMDSVLINPQEVIRGE